MIQKCKFQKRNDPLICVISFFGTHIFGSFFTQIGGSFLFLELAFLDHFCLTKFQNKNDPPICVEKMGSKNVSSKKEMIHRFMFTKMIQKGNFQT